MILGIHLHIARAGDCELHYRHLLLQLSTPLLYVERLWYCTVLESWFELCVRRTRSVKIVNDHGDTVVWTKLLYCVSAPIINFKHFALFEWYFTPGWFWKLFKDYAFGHDERDMNTVCIIGVKPFICMWKDLAVSRYMIQLNPQYVFFPVLDVQTGKKSVQDWNDSLTIKLPGCRHFNGCVPHQLEPKGMHELTVVCKRLQASFVRK